MATPNKKGGRTTPPKPRPAPLLTIEDILEAKKPHRVEVTVTVDQTTGQTAVFVFEAIGRVPWEKLLAAHPPTEEQQAEHRERQVAAGIPHAQRTTRRWNLETFPPVAIAASATSPKMTLAQARQLWDDDRWNPMELDKLYSAAVNANELGSTVNLGKELEAILASALS